jgi:molybdopterin-guanine dinucleotide biosynthesis protein B
MKVIGIAGWSGAGKTTLLSRLIPRLTERGHSVSTIKHAHHAFDVDRPGKDSYAHREAGASQVLIGSSKRWALLTELRHGREPSLRELLALLAPVDLVLVEGFKHEKHPKVEIHRQENAKPWLHPSDASVVGLIADATPPSSDLPIFGLDEIDPIASFVVEVSRPRDEVLKILQGASITTDD